MSIKIIPSQFSDNKIKQVVIIYQKLQKDGEPLDMGYKESCNNRRNVEIDSNIEENINTTDQVIQCNQLRE